MLRLQLIDTALILAIYDDARGAESATAFRAVGEGEDVSFFVFQGWIGVEGGEQMSLHEVDGGKKGRGKERELKRDGNRKKVEWGRERRGGGNMRGTERR